MRAPLSSVWGIRLLPTRRQKDRRACVDYLPVSAVRVKARGLERVGAAGFFISVHKKILARVQRVSQRVNP